MLPHLPLEHMAISDTGSSFILFRTLIAVLCDKTLNSFLQLALLPSVYNQRVADVDSDGTSDLLNGT